MKLLLLALLLTSCEGPAHLIAERSAPVCAGYGEPMRCEPWAREFNAKLKAEGVESHLVGYEWAWHGQTVKHLAVMWKDIDGWWAQDNLSGPKQVDSFGHYTWQERIENTLPVPTSIKIQHVWLDP